MKKLVLIYPDQLSINHKGLSSAVEADYIYFCECPKYFSKVKHHKQKIVLLLASMRKFAIELKDKGHNVIYQELDFRTDLITNLKKIIDEKNIESLYVQPASEYDDYHNLKNAQLDIKIHYLKEVTFYISRGEFINYAEDKNSILMENFYRFMRQKFNILMNDKKPKGGKWNFDKENRKPPKKDESYPDRVEFLHDDIVKDCIKLVNEKYDSNFGSLENFNYATSRKDALKALNFFIKELLPTFGDYQDAIVEKQPFLYHSLLSAYINIGLLSPFECIEKAEDAYNNQHAKINNVEGFIRQILGWREFVRGIYWLKMPEYKEQNYLKASNKLPSFLWDGKTDMNCIKDTVQSTNDYAYAHHIQRLMIIGNFALLTKIDPKEINNWFHIVYIDAYEWVELPNVSGMAIFADGGYLATKPYAASAAYINKMSNYCKNCKYNPKNKTEDDACPFNYLYWNFINENKEILKNNRRMSMIFSIYEKMNPSIKKSHTTKAKAFLDSL